MVFGRKKEETEAEGEKKSSARYEMDMCSGPVFIKIIVFAIPLILSGILQLLFNAAKGCLFLLCENIILCFAGFSGRIGSHSKEREAREHAIRFYHLL